MKTALNNHQWLCRWCLIPLASFISRGSLGTSNEHLENVATAIEKAMGIDRTSVCRLLEEVKQW